MALYVLFLLLTFCASTSASESEVRNELFSSSSLASFNGPSTIVNDSVCIINGEFVDTQTDITLVGPEPLIFRRNYSSSDESSWFMYKGWNLNYPSTIEMDSRKDLTKKFTVCLAEPSGAKLLYAKEKDKKNDIQTLLLENRKGLTNLGGGLISARTNLKNQTFQISKDTKSCIVRTSEGRVRTYTKYKGKGDSSNKHY